MIMNINKTLVRLYDAENNNMIAAFYTDNPSEFLKTYYFCKENDISINIPHDFDNENYIRYSELDYYWNEYFTKPGEKIFGGGVPVDMSTKYRKDIYYNNYAFTDLGLVGLGLIIGFPAVLLLVLCYVKCIWRFKEPKFQYLRFTLLLVLLGSLFTNAELYRTGNILLFSLFLYVEYINNRSYSPVLKKKNI